MALDKQALLNLFESELGLDVSDIDATTLLFSTGLVDSFSLVSLITFIEKEGGFRMSPLDVHLDHLDSIEKILEYVSKAAAQDA